MITLYNWIKKLKYEEWNYYSTFSDLELAKPFITENSSVDFIIDYLHQGGKEAITTAFSLHDFRQNRADHTISIFFLGLLVFHNSSMNGKKFFKGVKSKHYDFFQFIWFVACLSHDAAFYKEHDENLFETCSDIERLKAHFNIAHDLTKEEIGNVPADMFKLCSNYFKYRHEHRDYPVTDHGIYAGLVMYDCLVKNRRLKHENNSNDLLIWPEYLESQYAFAAATVAVHNIWFPTKKDEAIYREYGLDDLIGRNKITFDEAPLLFLLGLVDTIDPVKAYGKEKHYKPKFVLSNIYLSFNGHNTVQLKISKRLKFETMSLQAEKLKDWLAFDVQNMPEERTIKISM